MLKEKAFCGHLHYQSRWFSISIKKTGIPCLGAGMPVFSLFLQDMVPAMLKIPGIKAGYLSFSYSSLHSEKNPHVSLLLAIPGRRSVIFLPQPASISFGIEYSGAKVKDDIEKLYCQQPIGASSIQKVFQKGQRPYSTAHKPEQIPTGLLVLHKSLLFAASEQFSQFTV